MKGVWTFSMLHPNSQSKMSFPTWSHSDYTAHILEYLYFQYIAYHTEIFLISFSRFSITQPDLYFSYSFCYTSESNPWCSFVFFSFSCCCILFHVAPYAWNTLLNPVNQANNNSLRSILKMFFCWVAYDGFSNIFIVCRLYVDSVSHGTPHYSFVLTYDSFVNVLLSRQVRPL